MFNFADGKEQGGSHRIMGEKPPLQNGLAETGFWEGELKKIIGDICWV